jgi:hypothetical protein
MYRVNRAPIAPAPSAAVCVQSSALQAWWPQRPAGLAALARLALGLAAWFQSGADAAWHHVWRMFVHLLLFASCGAMAAAPLQAAGDLAPPVPEDRRALVIGNSAYEVFDALDNTTNDASAMCAALGRLGFRTACHLDVRDRASFLARIKEFAATLKPDTQTLFFYAGHAVQVAGENFLVPTGARVSAPKDIATQFVGMNDVFETLGPSMGRFQMVVLDACRNNPFAAHPANTVALADALAADPSRQHSRSALVSMLDASKAQYGRVAIKDAPAGTIVLYATAAEDAAFDGNDGNGSLTKHLLTHIGTPEITVEDMMKRVTIGVQNDTLKGVGKRQTPFVYSSFTGSFCFAGCPKVVDPAEIKRLADANADLDRRLKEQTRRADDATRKVRRASLRSSIRRCTE